MEVFKKNNFNYFFNEKGTILIVTIWIMSILSLLAIGIGFRMSLELKLIKFSMNKEKSRYLARAGINKFLTELVKDNNDYDSLNEKWSIGFDEALGKYIFKETALVYNDGENAGFFTIGYIFGKDIQNNDVYFYGASDEERRININKASLEVLKMLFPANQMLATFIDNWRGAGTSPGDEEFYATPERPYTAKHKSFDTVEELLLVRDMTPEIFQGIKDKVTVFGNGLVNLNTISPEVLKIIFQAADPGSAEILTEALINYRRNSGDDGNVSNNIFNQVPNNVSEFGLDDPNGIYQQAYNKAKPNFTVKSDYYRIRSLGAAAGAKVKKTLEAIVKKQSPKIMLYYREE